MKKNGFFIYCIINVLFLALPLSAQNNSSSALSNIWNKLTGSSTFVQNDLVGKWDFKSSACTFETENLLKKAGGALVASQVEGAFNEYCQKFGIKEGTTSYTFNSDSTYTAKLGSLKLSGKYKLDEKTKWMTMNYAFGIGKINAQVVKSGNTLKLMFDADNFLKMMKTLSMFTNNNKVEILAKMADMYDGMLLGFDLEKEK